MPCSFNKACEELDIFAGSGTLSNDKSILLVELNSASKEILLSSFAFSIPFSPSLFLRLSLVRKASSANGVKLFAAASSSGDLKGLKSLLWTVFDGDGGTDGSLRLMDAEDNCGGDDDDSDRNPLYSK